VPNIINIAKSTWRAQSRGGSVAHFTFGWQVRRLEDQKTNN